MDKAGEAMLQGMILLAAIGVLIVGFVIWGVRRLRRKRMAPRK